MSISRMTLRHPTGTTPVVVGDGALEAFVQEIGDWVAGRTVFIVTTPRVWSLHGEAVMPILSTAADGTRFEVPEGEAAKSVATAERLWGEMLAGGGKRDSRIIAFGGGSVGDLAGFAAGCFLRGLSFLQIPTTLLAQVDASIGGKTGINLPAAKNSVGLFHHPWATVADTRFLGTLPVEELGAGLMEVVKAGVVLDKELFEDLENGLDELMGGDATRLAPIVARAAQAKIDVVEKDPNENDLRRLLNFGHTLGHALEARLDYKALRHGEAVAYGMLFALRLASRRGLNRDAIDRICGLISRFKLPVLPAIDSNELIRLMRRDKKARETGLVWVLPTRIGSGQPTSEVDEDEVRRELDAFLKDPLDRP
jgi:3-dehydroquinate synthase